MRIPQIDKVILILTATTALSAYAQDGSMISLNPNSGNLVVDELSRAAASISGADRQQEFLNRPYNQKKIEFELKTSLQRIENNLANLNDLTRRGLGDGVKADSINRLSQELQSYQTIQKFARKYGNLDLKFKTGLKIVSRSNGTIELQIDYGDGKGSQRTLLKDVYNAVADRGLLNDVSNPGSTEEMQSFKTVTQEVGRVPMAVVEERPSARPQCDSCTTGGLFTEVIR